MLERRFHVQPLYPGSFMPEEGPTVRVDNPGTGVCVRAVPAKDRYMGAWFCLEVTDRWYQRWTADEPGAEPLWLPVPDAPPYRHARHRIYVGQAFTLAELAAWVGQQDDPDRYRALLANARDSGKMVRTRRGNWQPVTAHDVVLGEDELATYLQGAPA